MSIPIKFGLINNKWILFLLVPTLIYIGRKFEENLGASQNLFYTQFLKFFSRSFSCILWIILYKSINKEKKDSKINSRINTEALFPSSECDSQSYKTDKNDNNENIPKITTSIISQKDLYEIRMEEKEKNLKIELSRKERINYLILILSGIFDFIGSSTKYIFKYIKYREYVSGGLSILTSCVRLVVFAILSYFLLEYKKLEKHHYFSAMIIGIIVILIFVLSIFLEDKKYNDYYLLKIIFLFSPEILYCFIYTCGAIYLIRTQGNIYKLVFFNAIIGLFLSIIFQIILTTRFKCSDFKKYFVDNFEFCDGEKIESVLENLKNFKNFGGVLGIFLFMNKFVEIFFIWLLIYYFSVNHFASVYILPSFIDLFFKDNKFYNKIIYIGGFFIIFLMTLIYNEIFILYFWGLEKNTQKEIIKRSSDDTISISNNSVDNDNTDIGSDYSIILIDDKNYYGGNKKLK